MKHTANGTTTSPVLRGVWIMEKLLGQPPPPPPKNVPAVEPDIRGATTIRALLAKHTESQTCASCHAKFDPVGFAMENFDVMGAWRDHYRGMERGEKITGILQDEVPMLIPFALNFISVTTANVSGAVATGMGHYFTDNAVIS
jgi:hypothetical protein